MQLPEIHKYPYLSVDSETDGLYYPVHKAFMLSLATPDRKTYAWDFRKTPEVRAWADRELSQYRGDIITHNASFDYKMLLASGVRLPLDRLDDTVIRAVQIDENHGQIYPWTKGSMSYALDDLGEYYLRKRKDQSFYEKAREFFGNSRMSKQAIMSRIAELPFEITAPYAEQDALLCLELWEWQEHEIDKQGIRKICDFERSIIPHLSQSECRGMRVSVERTEQAMHDLDGVIDEHKDKLRDIIGFDMNPDSPKQVKELFEPKEGEDGEWYAIDGTPLPKTGKGQPSFKAEVLREMRHPAAREIVEIRSLVKTRDTFLGKHILEHEVNGKVYPTINQTASEDGGTRTGRLSYSNPAMQQIPSRDKRKAAIIKPCFLAPEGYKWVDADMQSFEVRVFAHLVAAYNDALVRAYQKDPNTDFHQYVAELTKLVRNAEYSGQPNAKQLNLSMIFNSGRGAIADKMGMEWEWAQFDTMDPYAKKTKTVRYKKPGPEASAVIDLYHQRVQGVKELADTAKRVAEKRGYIQTMYGRRLRFRKGYKAYKASGLLIQGTAADLNKENWKITNEALGDDGFLMLNTHDSYSMAIREDDWETPYRRVEAAIQRPVLRVPLILELSGVGNDWWDALQGVK